MVLNPTGSLVAVVCALLVKHRQERSREKNGKKIANA